jgi:hypothetical protein
MESFEKLDLSVSKTKEMFPNLPIWKEIEKKSIMVESVGELILFFHNL